MNSGCYENDISKVLRSIKVIDIDECIEKEIKREEIEFYYRGTNLSNKIYYYFSHNERFIRSKRKN